MLYVSLHPASHKKTKSTNKAMRAWPSRRVSTRFGKSCIPDPFSTLSPHLEALSKTMLDLVDSDCPSLSGECHLNGYLYQVALKSTMNG